MPDKQNKHPESDKAPQDDSPPPEPPKFIDEKGVERARAHPSDMPSEPVEGEGEGQHHRFHPETHDHFPDTSETDPPQGPSVPWEDGLLEILDHDQSYDGLEETEIVEDRAAAAARAQAAAAVERQQWIDSQAPESVMPDIDHVLGPPDFIPSGFPEPEHESAPASSWAFPFGWSVIAAAAFILAVAVGGFLLFGGGPDAGEVAVDTPSQAVDAAPAPAADVPAADVPAADVPAADAGSSLESSSSGSSDGPASPAATPTDSQPDACEVAAGQVSTLSFKSPDVGPAISKLFWFSSAYDLGFPTPAFEWEGVPEATTLLLITVQEINDAEADGRWHRQRHLRPRCRRMAHPRSMEGDNSEQPHGARQDLVHWWRRAGRYESGQPW